MRSKGVALESALMAIDVGIRGLDQSRHHPLHEVALGMPTESSPSV